MWNRNKMEHKMWNKVNASAERAFESLCLLLKHRSTAHITYCHSHFTLHVKHLIVMLQIAFLLNHKTHHTDNRLMQTKWTISQKHTFLLQFFFINFRKFIIVSAVYVADMHRSHIDPPTNKSYFICHFFVDKRAFFSLVVFDLFMMM